MQSWILAPLSALVLFFSPGAFSRSNDLLDALNDWQVASYQAAEAKKQVETLDDLRKVRQQIHERNIQLKKSGTISPSEFAFSYWQLTRSECDWKAAKDRLLEEEANREIYEVKKEAFVAMKSPRELEPEYATLWKARTARAEHEVECARADFDYWTFEVEIVRAAYESGVDNFERWITTSHRLQEAKSLLRSSKSALAIAERTSPSAKKANKK